MNEQQQLALDDIKLLVEANHELQLTGEDESEFGGAAQQTIFFLDNTTISQLFSSTLKMARVNSMKKWF